MTQGSSFPSFFDRSLTARRSFADILIEERDEPSIEAQRGDSLRNRSTSKIKGGVSDIDSQDKPQMRGGAGMRKKDESCRIFPKFR